MQQPQSKQRQIVEQMLIEAYRALFPKELLDKAQALLPTLGIATVFLSLKKVVDESCTDCSANPS